MPRRARKDATMSSLGEPVEPRSPARRATATAIHQTCCGGIAVMTSRATRSSMRTRAVRRRRTGWPRSAPHNVGCAGSAPTSARQCQHRSHFGVGARRDRIANASPRQRVAAEVIVTNRRSSPSAASAVVIRGRGRGDRDFRPATTSRSRPTWRTASSSFCTAARTAGMRCHFAMQVRRVLRRAAAHLVHVRTKIVGSSAWTSRHASSAVNDRIGAIRLEERVADQRKRGLRASGGARLSGAVV